MWPFAASTVARVVYRQSMPTARTPTETFQSTFSILSTSEGTRLLHSSRRPQFTPHPKILVWCPLGDRSVKDCGVQMQVLKESSSGGHKFKVRTITLVTG